MHILILGGSGRTGQVVIKKALEQGHTITALVRDDNKFTIDGSRPPSQITVVKGNSMQLEDVRRAFSNPGKPIPKPDAVVVTLSAPRATDSPFAKSISPARLMADSVGNAIKAMNEHGVSYITVMQAFGVGSSKKNLNFLMRWVIDYSEMSKQFKDHNDVADELIEAAKSGIFKYTLVRPAMLKGEGAMEVKYIGEHGEKGSFMPKISRESVAEFIVNECLMKRKWDDRTPVICN